MKIVEVPNEVADAVVLWRELTSVMVRLDYLPVATIQLVREEAAQSGHPFRAEVLRLLDAAIRDQQASK